MMQRSNILSGPLTRFGITVAAIACLLDQASKLYLLHVVDLAANPIRLGPFFDFVLTRNTGISYGLFQTEGAIGQWVLLGFKAAAVIALWLWLARAHDRLREQRHAHSPRRPWLHARLLRAPHAPHAPCHESRCPNQGTGAP